MKFCWCTINVKNMEESIEFYEDIVGLSINKRFPAGPGVEIAFLGQGETQVELICYEDREEVEIGQDISLGFEVGSIDKKISFLKERGIDIHSGPFEPNPQTRFFFILDPNGLKIQFVESVK